MTLDVALPPDAFDEPPTAGTKAEARRLALEEAAVICDEVGHRAGKPDNRRREDPCAAFQSAAAKCAWEIRQRLKAHV